MRSTFSSQFSTSYLGAGAVFVKFWICTVPDIHWAVLQSAERLPYHHSVHYKYKRQIKPLSKKQIGSPNLCHAFRHLLVRRIWFVTLSTGPCLGNLNCHLSGMAGGLRYFFYSISLLWTETAKFISRLFYVPEVRSVSISPCNLVAQPTTFLCFVFFSVFTLRVTTWLARLELKSREWSQFYKLQGWMVSFYSLLCCYWEKQLRMP